MKFYNWIIGVLIAGVLVVVGCGKSQPTTTPESTTRIIDATHFRPAFESASPEIKSIVNEVMMSIQGSDYNATVAKLDKLAALPDLTEAQKKAVADLSEQVKKKIAELQSQP